MRIELAGAAAIAAQILWLSSVAGPLATVFNFLACAALTLLLWIATRGRRPVAVTGGVAALGLFVADPWAAAAAALLTGGTLYVLQGKPACAASSQR
jgi:hypothetical protein